MTLWPGGFGAGFGNYFLGWLGLLELRLAESPTLIFCHAGTEPASVCEGFQAALTRSSKLFQARKPSFSRSNDGNLLVKVCYGETFAGNQIWKSLSHFISGNFETPKGFARAYHV